MMRSRSRANGVRVALGASAWRRPRDRAGSSAQATRRAPPEAMAAFDPDRPFAPGPPRPHIGDDGDSQETRMTRTQASLTLSDAAARRLRAISAAEGRTVMLRVAVDGGGCSGFQYRFELVEAANDDDICVERDGAAAVVDVISLGLLAGSEIDFADELAAAEFRVRNPNAKTSCGCGVSFSI